MKFLILFFLVVAVALLAIAAPAQNQPIPLDGTRLVRAARLNLEPKDLEGSESAYVAYPYGYPYYWTSYYPYVVGK